MQNRPNWTKQAILATALFALGGAAIWYEYKQKPKEEALEEQSKKAFNLKDTRVQAISLSDGSGRTFELKCSEQSADLCKPGDNSKWELAQPSKLKADDSNANALVSALNNLNVTETIDLKDETPEKRAALLKEYGLDAASRTAARKVSVTTPQGTTQLHLGGTHPIGDSLFAMLEGKEDKVYLVPTYFKANFDHDLTYWRDKKLMTASAHEVESFKLEGGKAALGGSKKDGAWTLTTAKGDSFPGDIENIDNVLTAATYLSAKGFVADRKDDPKAKAALQGARKALSLTIQQSKGAGAQAPAPITLTLLQKPAKDAKNAKPQLLATVSNLDPLYELDPTAIDRLNKDLKDFRLAKLITSMERFSAKRLEFAGKELGPSPLVLKNADGKWTVEGDTIEPSAERVQTLLDRLSGNRIQEFLATAPAGEPDGLTLKLTDEKGETKRHLVFWKSGPKLYARDLGAKRKEAFLVDPSVADVLPKSRDYFAKKDPPIAPQGQPGMPQAPAHGHGADDGHGHGGPAGESPAPDG